MTRTSRADDLTGRTFGRWAVIRRSSHKPRRDFYTYWDCKCSCGWFGVVERRSLVSGRSKSCGCYHAELKRARVSELTAQNRKYRKVSLSLGLKPAEIAALVRVADMIKANSGVEFAFFNTDTEEGTKELARYNSAVMKLRAKHRRIERMREGDKKRAAKDKEK